MARFLELILVIGDVFEMVYETYRKGVIMYFRSEIWFGKRSKLICSYTFHF